MPPTSLGNGQTSRRSSNFYMQSPKHQGHKTQDENPESDENPLPRLPCAIGSCSGGKAHRQECLCHCTPSPSPHEQGEFVTKPFDLRLTRASLRMLERDALSPDSVRCSA